jgi:hypothetical protein
MSLFDRGTASYLYFSIVARYVSVIFHDTTELIFLFSMFLGTFQK